MRIYRWLPHIVFYQAPTETVQTILLTDLLKPSIVGSHQKTSLVQIEVLSQLEQGTGRKITELFDWIVGSSTGGILALCMAYGKLPVVSTEHTLHNPYDILCDVGFLWRTFWSRDFTEVHYKC